MEPSLSAAQQPQSRSTGQRSPPQQAQGKWVRVPLVPHHAETADTRDSNQPEVRQSKSHTESRPQLKQQRRELGEMPTISKAKPKWQKVMEPTTATQGATKEPTARESQKGQRDPGQSATDGIQTHSPLREGNQDQQPADTVLESQKDTQQVLRQAQSPSLCIFSDCQQEDPPVAKEAETKS